MVEQRGGSVKSFGAEELLVIQVSIGLKKSGVAFWRKLAETVVDGHADEFENSKLAYFWQPHLKPSSPGNRCKRAFVVARKARGHWQVHL
jgi:hypothetical protein